MKRQLILCCALPAIAVLFASSVQAQPHRSHRVVRPGTRYVPPQLKQQGAYYFKNNKYYYQPDTYNSGRVVTTRPQAVAFGSFSHVDELAVRLESLANDFCLEIYYNYSRNRGFEDTYREAYEILEIAKYIHEEEHHGHRDEIAKELSGLDKLFHHVGDDVANWRPNRGHHHHHGHGTDIHELLEQMESVLHHLMNDVGVKARKPSGPAPAPRP